jgi:hypothetical protein
MTITSTLPATGGGYPFVAVGARPINPFDRETVVTFTMRLSMDAEAEANGRRTVDLVREACVERDMERVAILHILFRNLVCRVPEFHVLLGELVERDDRKALVKLLDLPRRGRGRRPGDRFYFVALVEHVMESQGFEEAKAAVAWLIQHRSELELPDNWLPRAKTMLNQHARLGEYFQLWSSCVYVKPELLTLMPPEMPGVTFTPEMIELARFPPKNGVEWPYGFLIEIHPPSTSKP